MPRWICPSCSAVMSFKPQLVGQLRACPKCNKVSALFDADDVPDGNDTNDEVAPTPVSVPVETPIQTAAPPETKLSPNPFDGMESLFKTDGNGSGLVEVLRIVHLFIAIIGVAGLLVFSVLFQSFELLIATPFLILGVAWTFVQLDVADDIYRSRRLLERISDQLPKQ